MTVEIVVVGAGLAGLVAANRLSGLGRQVVVLEQGADEDYLCNSRIATGAFNFAHSDPELDPQALVAAVEADTEGHADPALAQALAGVVGRAFAWLRAEGTEFTVRNVGGKRSWLMVPLRPAEPGLEWQGYGPDRLVRQLSDRLRRRGGSIMLGARARSLVMKGGRCVGVEVDFNHGRKRIDASAVILADGGFQGNPDMVREYISGHPEALVQRSAGTGRGDAIVMAQRAGARLLDMDRFYGHLLSRVALDDVRFWPYPTLDSLTGGSILVDGAGRRFLDEGLGGILQSNIIAQREDPLSATVIFDDAIWNSAGREESVPPNPTLENVPGALFSTPALPGLARAFHILTEA